MQQIILLAKFTGCDLFYRKKIILATKANHRSKIWYVCYCGHLIFMFLVYLGQTMLGCIGNNSNCSLFGHLGNSESLGSWKMSIFGKYCKKIVTGVNSLFWHENHEKMFLAWFFLAEVHLHYGTYWSETFNFCHPWISFELWLIFGSPWKFFSRFLGYFRRFSVQITQKIRK